MKLLAGEDTELFFKIQRLCALHDLLILLRSTYSTEKLEITVHASVLVSNDLLKNF